MSSFAVLLMSKITNDLDCAIASENYRALFSNLLDRENIGTVYSVDDSPTRFRGRLQSLLSGIIAKDFPSSEIQNLNDNASVFDAVNRVWPLIKEPYTISFHHDFRVIQEIPLAVMKKAMDKYKDIYLIYLRARALFGYNDANRALMKEQYPWFKSCPDDKRERWFTEYKGRIYSIPPRMFDIQRRKAKDIPRIARGVRLIPRPVDEKNYLWTPLIPSRLIPSWPLAESFAGGPSVFRTQTVRRYIPLKEKYRKLPAEYCQEAYFLYDTGIDLKYYTAYLNLQAFAFQYIDEKRPCENVEEKYWREYKKQNCEPFEPAFNNQAGSLFLKTQVGVLRSAAVAFWLLKKIIPEPFRKNLGKLFGGARDHNIYGA